MQLAMTLLVRDEADIVRENLEFHLARGVDHIIATDNGSSDGTVEILEDYARAGVLTLFHEPSRDFQKEIWVTRMAFLARDEFGADWILNNDADEFWRPPSGPDGQSGNLKTVLAERTAKLLTCQRYNMICAIKDLEKHHWRDSLVWRKARRRQPLPNLADPLRDRLLRPYFMYDLPSKVMVRSEGLVEVDRGCHNAHFEPPASREDCEISIYHFPIRTKAEFQASVAQFAQALARDQTVSPKTSWKYRRWGQMLAEEGSIDSAFAEALPSKLKFWYYLVRGDLVRDWTMRDELEAL